jgi:Flp pilus assembly pilin Flp
MPSRNPMAERMAVSRRIETGQGLAEYALILALIVVIALAALLFLGTQISSILSAIAAQI